MREAQKER